MHLPIGDAENGDRRDHGQVAPVPPGDDLAGDPATRTTGNDRSAPVASQGGTSAETKQAIRPSSHNPARSASGPPLTGRRWVQFGIAVSRKPATAAITKPNSISWICQ